jgi:carboxylesterase
VIDTRAIPNLMPGAEPVFSEGGETGILFFHGFTGSPYEGREFASHFSQKGYTVWVPLLPGHGTDPKDLLNISWRDWYTFGEDCLSKLKKQCNKIILAGQSMGSSLALALAAHHPVESIISLAGAVFLKDWRLILLPIARKLVPYHYKSRGPDVSSREAKKNSASYRKYPVSSIDEFLSLLKFAKGNLIKIQAPLLLIHSRNDHTITYKNMDYIYSHVASTFKRRLTVENSFHIVSVDNDKAEVFQAVEDFLIEVKLLP